MQLLCFMALFLVCFGLSSGVTCVYAYQTVLQEDQIMIWNDEAYPKCLIYLKYKYLEKFRGWFSDKNVMRFNWTSGQCFLDGLSMIPEMLISRWRCQDMWPPVRNKSTSLSSSLWLWVKLVLQDWSSEAASGRTYQPHQL